VAKLVGRSDFARFETTPRAIRVASLIHAMNPSSGLAATVRTKQYLLRERSSVKLENLDCSGLFFNRSRRLGEVPPEDISPENRRKRVGRYRDYFLMITS
jgi:hypothetical protein